VAKKKIKGFKPGVDGVVPKFPKAPPLTEAEIGSAAHWSPQSEAEACEAQEWFDAFLHQDGGEFCANLAADPPSPIVIWRLVQLAHRAEHPQWKEIQARKKWEKQYRAAYAAAIEAWQANLSLPKPKSKPALAKSLAHHLKGQGHAIAASTIEKWFPKKKQG